MFSVFCVVFRYIQIGYNNNIFSYLPFCNSLPLKNKERLWTKADTIINNGNLILSPMVMSFARGGQMLICLLLSKQQHVASSRGPQP